MRFSHIASAGIALTVACLTVEASKAADGTPTTAPAKPPQFKLIIGHDTTRIDGPVLADGTIDYNSAFCEIALRGITSENNAAPAMQAALASWVQYRPSSLSSDDSKKRDAQLTQALAAPWAADRLPFVDEWLKANEKNLAAIADAAGKPRLGPGKAVAGGLPGPNLPMGLFREAGRALIARATRRLALGNQAGAMADIATAHQVAVLLSQFPDQAGGIVALPLEETASRVQLAAIRASDLATSQKWFLQRLGEEPAIPSLLAAEDVGQRYQDLHQVMAAIRGQLQPVVGDLTFINQEPLFVENGKPLAIPVGDLNQTDWNIVLQHINDIDDQAVAIMREEDPAKRLARSRTFRSERKAESSPGDFYSEVLGPSLLDPGTSGGEQSEKRLRDAFLQKVAAFLRRGPDETVQAYSRRVAGMFTHASDGLDYWARTATIAQVKYRVYTVAMALDIFKKENGTYPESLAALVPGLLPKPPLDPFSNGQLSYRRVAAGYTIYSVGPNGIDDHGDSSAGKDDIAVRSTN